MNAMFGIKAWFRRFIFVPLAALVLANVPAVWAEKTGVFAVAEEEFVAWEKTLSDYEAGTLNTRIPHTVLSAPPPVLARLLAEDGCGSDLRIIIHKSILDKTFGKTASKFTGDFHKIALADMRNLLRELADPIAVFDSAHGNGDKVVLTTLKDTETGESVIVAIKINVPGNNVGRVNAIASIHGRQIGSFHKWLKDDLLRYYHTKKFPQWLVSVGVRNPRASIPCGKKILTEKDFRHVAPAAKKRNCKTSKSAFFKNDANVLAIPTNAFVCGNSTLSGCRAEDLPGRCLPLVFGKGIQHLPFPIAV